MFIQAEEVVLDLFRFSKSTFGERVVVDDVCNESPLIAEDGLIPKEEGLFNRVWLLLNVHECLAVLALDEPVRIHWRDVHVEILCANHVLLHLVFEYLLIDQ